MEQRILLNPDTFKIIAILLMYIYTLSMILNSVYDFFQVIENLYKPHIEEVPLFKGCSMEFINQIVSLSGDALYMLIII